jgi:ketosteroid isomerase-like protein
MPGWSRSSKNWSVAKQSSSHPNPSPDAAAHALGLPDNLLDFPTDTNRAVAQMHYTNRFARTPSVKYIFSHARESIPYLAARFAIIDEMGFIEGGNARAQGVVAIQRFLNGLPTKVPDFRFENVRIWIETPDRVFGEYDAQGHVVSTGKLYKQTYAGLLVAEHGTIKLLREALDTLAASRALNQEHTE